jgi:tetratricopeptide (TPR) repeat protein
VSSVYVRAVNQAIREGRSRLEQDRPADAGRLFHGAQKHYPQYPALASRICLTPAELDAAIAKCAQQLMEEGLSAYRQERLKDAIEIWEKILVFDPMHRAGRSAIETAERQLANLKKIGTGPEQESR